MKLDMKLDVKWLIIPVIIIAGFVAFTTYQHKNNEKLETYNRQLSGDLTSMEQELQDAHHELGVMESQLLSEKELAKRWKNSKEATDKKFRKFIKRHNLKIKSMDNAIARLKQKIKGGQSEAVPTNCTINKECTISYVWRDKHNRFILKDPNIFEKNNEEFESNQVFAIRGIIAEQKDGSLQVRRITLSEVRKNSKGEYESILGGKAKIVESDFQYSNLPDTATESTWKDLFTLRPIVLGSVAAFPDSGDLKLGLGIELFNYKGFGINTHTGFSFTDIKKIEQRIGLSYNPTILGNPLNLAIGVSAGTPFAYFGSRWSANVDLIFYLW